jgi:hypothetical protein
MQLGRAPVCHGIIAAWPTIPIATVRSSSKIPFSMTKSIFSSSRFACTLAALPANAVRVLEYVRGRSGMACLLWRHAHCRSCRRETGRG